MVRVKTSCVKWKSRWRHSPSRRKRISPPTRHSQSEMCSRVSSSTVERRADHRADGREQASPGPSARAGGDPEGVSSRQHEHPPGSRDRAGGERKEQVDLCTLKEELRSREDELKRLRQRVETLDVALARKWQVDGAERERAHSPTAAPAVASDRQRRHSVSRRRSCR